MFGRRNGYGYNGGESFIEEVLKVEAIEDLAEGNIGGFVEDEMLASIF